MYKIIVTYRDEVRKRETWFEVASYGIEEGMLTLIGKERLNDSSMEQRLATIEQQISMIPLSDIRRIDIYGTFDAWKERE